MQILLSNFLYEAIVDRKQGVRKILNCLVHFVFPCTGREFDDQTRGQAEPD
jgi:hypothetical protein